MTIVSHRVTCYIAMVTIGVAMVVQAYAPRCRTLHPDPEALAERIAFHGIQKLSSPRLRASVSVEMLLDVIDVLVAFDSSALKWLESNCKMSPLDYAQRKIDEMNECLANSRISAFRFRLVGAVCVNVDASGSRFSDGSADLDAILSGKLVDGYGNVIATGEWAKIVECRERLGADVVSVLVSVGVLGTVGISYSLEDYKEWVFSQNIELVPHFGDWAYSVCSIDANDKDYIMLHEIGHIMGCGHPDSSCASESAIYLGPQLYSYSSGYYAWIEGEGYYTVMGYNFGGLRQDGSYDSLERFKALPFFSSPVLSYIGVALGTEINNNRQTILNTCAYVAQYRVSRLALDAEPETDIGDKSVPTHVFSTSFNPTVAIKGSAPYLGAVYKGGTPVAIIALRCGKAATKGKRAGTSKVSVEVTGLDCKKKTSKAVYVNCGYDAKAKFVVKDWGTVSLTLGGEGFVGTIGDEYTVRTALAGGTWPHTRACVDVDFANGTAVLPDGVIDYLLPTLEKAEPVFLDGGKWTFAKAAQIKYKKVKDTVTKEAHYELQGTDDSEKTNLSAMKLQYVPNKGTFKGGFKIYELKESGNKYKLKKYSAKVTGIVVDGTGYGTAIIKNVGDYRVSVFSY